MSATFAVYEIFHCNGISVESTVRHHSVNISRNCIFPVFFSFQTEASIRFVFQKHDEPMKEKKKKNGKSKLNYRQCAINCMVYGFIPRAVATDLFYWIAERKRYKCHIILSPSGFVNSNVSGIPRELIVCTILFKLKRFI